MAYLSRTTVAVKVTSLVSRLPSHSITVEIFPDFLSVQSCETQSGMESLGMRLHGNSAMHLKYCGQREAATVMLIVLVTSNTHILCFWLHV